MLAVGTIRPASRETFNIAPLCVSRSGGSAAACQQPVDVPGLELAPSSVEIDAGSAVLGRSEPGAESVAKALVGALSHPRDIAVRPNQQGSGSRDRAERWKLPYASVPSVDPSHPIRPERDVERVAVTEIEQDWSSLLQAPVSGI